MNQLKKHVISNLRLMSYGLGFENIIKSSVGVNLELWRYVDDTTQRCFAQVLFYSPNNNLWTSVGGADPPFSVPLGRTHSHRKRALRDPAHVAADRSICAGRNPVYVMKLNKIERNSERTSLILCI